MIIPLVEIAEEGREGHAHAEQHGLDICLEACPGVGVIFSARDVHHELIDDKVSRKRPGKRGEAPKPAAHNAPHIPLIADKALYEIDNVKTRRNGEVRLIYPQREAQRNDASRPAPPTGGAQRKIHRRHGKKHRKRIRRAGEHIGKGDYLRGEHDEQRGEQRRDQRAFKLKYPYDEADRRREQQQ